MGPRPLQTLAAHPRGPWGGCTLCPPCTQVSKRVCVSVCGVHTIHRSSDGDRRLWRLPRGWAPSEKAAVPALRSSVLLIVTSSHHWSRFSGICKAKAMGARGLMGPPPTKLSASPQLGWAWGCVHAPLSPGTIQK